MKRTIGWAAARFRNQEGQIQQGEGRGLKFNAAGANAGYLLGTSEPSVQSALAALILPKMTVYDVGANVGFFSVIAARLVGSHGHVVAFEPLATNADQVTHNARLNNFAHINVRVEALGNENGSASFLASKVPTLGRLAKLGPLDESCSEVIVAVRQLDTVVEEAALPPPDLIKMDVEGAEADVLAGATDNLSRVRPILLIELHGTNDAVSKKLDSLDYSSYVLGSRASVVEAPWNAHIIAVPKERVDLTSIVETLTDPALAS